MIFILFIGIYLVANYITRSFIVGEARAMRLERELEENESDENTEAE